MKSTLDKSPAAVQERHDKRRGWFLAEASRQSANRAMMAEVPAAEGGAAGRVRAAGAVEAGTVAHRAAATRGALRSISRA